MADDYSWIGPLISGVAKGVNSLSTADKADSQIQAAYDQLIANIKARMADFDGVGSAGYSELGAEQLGRSALEDIQLDPQARIDQQQAIAALDELAQRGGLSLGDIQALNEIQANLNRNTLARRKGTANEFAARGQLGAGAQLAMDLAGQQQAAQSANERGESIAAQAQQRALQALLQKGQMARQMTNDDFGRKSEAAKAKDLIAAQNAKYRTDAGRYNNSIRGQAFDDRFKLAQGKAGVTRDMNEVLYNRGKQNASTTAAKGGFTNDMISAGGTAISKWMESDSGKSGKSDSGDDGYEDGYSEDDEINFGDDD